MAKPERLSGESPVEYYKRTHCCPDDFMEPHKGKWFCNPAHCHHEFDTEAARDEHLRWAYSLLD